MKAGQTLQQPPLPDYSGPPVKEVRRWIAEYPPMEKRPLGWGLEFAHTLPDTIQVPSHLENPHPLLKITEEYLRSTMTNKYGVFFSRSGIINLRVSPALLDRALRIMNSLILAVEGLGFAATVGGTGNTKSYIEVRGIKVEFILEEEVRRKAHLQSPEEMGKISQGVYVWIPRWDYHPTGNLILRITDVWCQKGVMKNFKDTLRKSIEDRLPDFIKAVLEVAAKQDRYEAGEDPIANALR